MTKENHVDLTTLLAKKKEYMDAIEKDGQALLKEEFKSFFTAFPNVLAVKWRQYTPYFNDGDACVFGVGSIEVLIEAVKGFNGRSGWCSSYQIKTKKLSDAIDEISRGVQAIPEIMQQAFGDHAECSIERGSTEIVVEEFEHD